MRSARVEPANKHWSNYQKNFKNKTLLHDIWQFTPKFDQLWAGWKGTYFYSFLQPGERMDRMDSSSTQNESLSEMFDH